MYDGHGKSQLERHCRQGYASGLISLKSEVYTGRVQESNYRSFQPSLSTSSRSFPFLTNWSNFKTLLFGLVQAMPTSPRT
ncbi:hypothetical protein POPTR_001G394701v4 [Populus trichocarpa]|uniref:Uncharacterized protein n=1 Tax=Populus trichocarpa TaxID=3694 RepID=A0ACC0TNV0_POPTR|nr:hypothetical protein POPTR_001G394701v4 [Populus trichocarpa]